MHVYGCECEQFERIDNIFTLGPDNSRITYSLYNVKGGYVADASCHADMWIEFMWKDEVRNKTDEKPPIVFNFVAAGGNVYFDIDNPAIVTNNDGTKSWSYKQSQAQDKNLQEGTSYGIEVAYGTAQPEGEVTCILHIGYREFNENAHKDGCELGGTI